MLVTSLHPNLDSATVIRERQLRVESGASEYVHAVHPAILAQVETGSAVNISARFREGVDLFEPKRESTPAGFRVETTGTHSVTLDLVRDIGYARDGQRRPTSLLFSADSANPYEIAECRDLIANVTCNPGIVYDLFLNNPEANVGGQFSDLNEVLQAIGDEVGPGCDISVELHDPYEQDFAKILDEIQMYEDILSRYRLVVKVPHTGAISPSASSQLLTGDGLLNNRYYDGSPEDLLRGHSLAHKLHELGHRVNFTLMFEPYQTPLALQIRPYFINAFIRNRLSATRRISGLLAAFEATEDSWFIRELRQYLIANHYLGKGDAELDLLETLSQAKRMVAYRHNESSDGLDSARASVRWLRASNLPDSRLIVCSLDGDTLFPMVMSMLVEPEFIDLQDRVLLTTDPRYLARWASSPHVISYQQRFLKACEGSVSRVPSSAS